MSDELDVAVGLSVEDDVEDNVKGLVDPVTALPTVRYGIGARTALASIDKFCAQQMCVTARRMSERVPNCIQALCDFLAPEQIEV